IGNLTAALHEVRGEIDPIKIKHEKDIHNHWLVAKQGDSTIALRLPVGTFSITPFSVPTALFPDAHQVRIVDLESGFAFSSEAFTPAPCAQ
ncbi:MAG: hypothetical protein RRY29_10480, partial [Desulfovibrionaceae bacterium]